MAKRTDANAEAKEDLRRLHTHFSQVLSEMNWAKTKEVRNRAYKEAARRKLELLCEVGRLTRLRFHS